MKKWLCRTLSALVVVMMAVSAACSGGNGGAAATTTVPDSGTAADGSAEQPADDGPLTPYAEPITIGWGVQTSQVQQFFDGDTYENNRWSRLIKEKLNIDLEVAFSADITTDAYRDKLNALLAAGDLPDVFRWADRNFMTQAYNAGYLMDITDVFANYASDDVKAYQTSFPDSFEGASYDGRLYGFPYMNDNFHQAPYLWIRDDWLANLNAEVPKTLDDMVALAKRFTFDDPDGNGANDTFGLALDKHIIINNFGTAQGILSAYGEPSYAAGMTYFYRDDTGKITSPYIKEGMKKTLSLLHDLYAEGVIDPEFITKDTATMEPDVTNGKYGMMYHMNWGTWHPYNFSFQQSDVITRPYAIPTDEANPYKIGVQSSKTGDVFMINAATEHPEAIIKILNLYEEVCVQVPNEEDYLTYWDNEQYRLSPIYVGIPTELHTQELLDAFDKGSPDDLAGSVKPLYSQISGFADKSDVTTTGYGAWGQMFSDGADGGGSCVIALRKYRPDGAYVDNIMSVDQPEIFMQNSSVWESMMETAFTDIIRGDRPVDYFDVFVSDWLNAGGQQCLDELETLYP
ncbi:MAG: extracellular solute-binding protein [Clostridiales bacterium]|jgi:putative aldouronate transport system substrate-binding protein|nr:extracellular solute-binding protein [Clostridiales bacterium]